MITLDQEFSRFLKIQKSKYIFKEEVEWGKIDDFLDQLSKVDLSSLKTDNQKKAFWINVYNGLTNYWIIKKKIKKKMKENPLIFVFYKANIGGVKLTLDNIEHGILRRNAKTSYRPVPQFLFSDKRKKLMCEELDYRIHFALNCGAVSCPAIAFYDSINIDDQLKEVEELFVETEFEVLTEEKELSVSQIFVWYKEDFKNTYLNDSKYKDYHIIPKEYDWSIS